LAACRATTLDAMNYVQEVVAAIRSAVGDEAADEPGSDELFRFYAVLALVKGQDVTAENVHDAWSAWMTGREPNHHSIRPFAQLSAEVRRADGPFVAAIRQAAARLATRK
jgi:hypothetical protein